MNESYPEGFELVGGTPEPAIPWAPPDLMPVRTADSEAGTACCFLNAATCPDCGGGMVRLGGCFSCPACGYGSCG